MYVLTKLHAGGRFCRLITSNVFDHAKTVQRHLSYEDHLPARQREMLVKTYFPAAAKSFADLRVVNVRSHGRDFPPLNLRPDEKRIHGPGDVTACVAGGR